MYLEHGFQFIPSRISTARPAVTTLHKKGSGDINEDVVLAGCDTYGVFDGATSLVGALYEGEKTGGRKAAEICKNAFGASQNSLVEAAGEANILIREEALRCGVNYKKKNEIWAVSASAVKIHEECFSWCQIGDCSIVVIYEDCSCRLLGRYDNHDAVTLKMWQSISSTTHLAIRDAVSDQIASVRSRMNIDYGVLNGEGEALNFLKHGEESLRGVSSIVIYSDGLMLPQVNPEKQQDVERFSSLFLTGGLNAVYEYVYALQMTDLNCRKYPRFKAHDDIGAVALSFPSS